MGRTLNVCPYADCRRPADSITPAEADRGKLPEAGDVSVCFGCGRLALFTGRGLELRRPSAGELELMLADDEILAAIAAWEQVTGGQRRG